ncbi:MAG: hypothetical protein NT027_05990 [Proteobacteria bacterium]|nr:hypothetical protein [Pseudomonadota bacterium]
MKTACLAKEESRQLLLSDSRIRTASTNPMEVKLCCGIRELDEFLHGGLTFSTLSEWGIPFGNGARRLMALFLATATGGATAGDQKHWCLWVSARPHHSLYPPAWSAAGVDLHRLRYCQSKAPIKDLRSLFIDDFFRVIVLDAPAELTLEDCCFLSQHARRNRQLIIILRDQFLLSSNHNVWARSRFNVKREKGRYEIEAIRGALSKSKATFAIPVPNLKNLNL